MWLSVWSEVQIVCILSSWCHCHPKTPSSLAPFISRLVLLFWYWHTQVVLEKGLFKNEWGISMILCSDYISYIHTYIHTYTRLTAIFLGLSRWASTRKVKPIWILLKQETVCISLQPDNHTSTPLLSFYRPDALPAAQPTASKHWRQIGWLKWLCIRQVAPPVHAHSDLFSAVVEALSELAPAEQYLRTDVATASGLVIGRWLTAFC